MTSLSSQRLLGQVQILLSAIGFGSMAIFARYAYTEGTSTPTLLFLRFGLDLVRALHSNLRIAGPMVVTFVVLSALPHLAKRMPPLIGALLVGAVAVALGGQVNPDLIGSLTFAQPVLQAPV